MEWWLAGRAPYRFPVPFNEHTHEYNWQVDLPVGGPYLVSMYDGNGATGGEYTLDVEAGTNIL
ncbi:hypothetical protein FRC04_004434, partial [Tulasnella sp. 424]